MDFDAFRTPGIQPPDHISFAVHLPVVGSDLGESTGKDPWAERLRETEPQVAQGIGELVTPVESPDITAPATRGRREQEEAHTTPAQSRWREPPEASHSEPAEPAAEQRTTSQEITQSDEDQSVEGEAATERQPQTRRQAEAAVAEEQPSTHPAADDTLPASAETSSGGDADSLDDALANKRAPALAPMMTSAATKPAEEVTPAVDETPVPERPLSGEIRFRQPALNPELVSERFTVPDNRDEWAYVNAGEYSHIRDQVLAEMPSHTEEIHEERIDAFFAAKGGRTAPALILNPDEVPLLRQRLVAAGYPNPATVDKFIGPDEWRLGQGLYIPDLDMILAVKWTYYGDDMRALEYVVAHEKAHSLQEYNFLTLPLREYRPPFRSRLYTGPSNVITEGGAEYLAAQYMRLQYGPNGVWDRPLIKLKDDPSKFTIPATYILKYAGSRNPEEPRASSVVFAGYAMELLCECIPELPGLLIQAAQSPRGLVKLIQTLHAFEPNLYENLLHRGYGNEAYRGALRFVKTLVKSHRRHTEHSRSIER